MTIKTITRMGNPDLYQIIKPVTEFNTPKLHALIQDLWDTMIENRGVGIAAPQIGIPLQITVFGFEKSQRYPQAASVPKTVLINPTLELLGKETNEDWEGCISVKGIRGLVTRHTKIRYSGYDETGNFFQREASGFHARLVQHEHDHLTNKLFFFRIKNMRNFGFEEELTEIMQTTGCKLS